MNTFIIHIKYQFKEVKLNRDPLRAVNILVRKGMGHKYLDKLEGKCRASTVISI